MIPIDLHFTLSIRVILLTFLFLYVAFTVWGMCVINEFTQQRLRDYYNYDVDFKWLWERTMTGTHVWAYPAVLLSLLLNYLRFPNKERIDAHFDAWHQRYEARRWKIKGEPQYRRNWRSRFSRNDWQKQDAYGEWHYVTDPEEIARLDAEESKESEVATK